MDINSDEYLPQLGIIGELGFGIILVLAGISGFFPLFEIKIVMVIVIAASLPLMLYVLVILTLGTPTKWPYDSKGMDKVIFILVLASLFLADIIGETGLHITIGICGVIVILLASWHLRIYLHGPDTSNTSHDALVKEEDGVEGV